MIAHVWFLAVVLTGHPDNGFTQGMAAQEYPTRAACMADARLRMQGPASIGDHGRYLCMYHDESDAELDRTPIGTF